MKTENIILHSLMFISLLIVTYACSDSDGYSLNNFRVSIATVVPEGHSRYSLTLDNGEKLWPAATQVYYSPKIDQRVIVNYTLLSDKMNGYDHYIRVNDIWNVLTKPIIELTEEIADSIGNDPVKINGFWIGDNYLNASFAFNYGGVKPHAINMVQNMMVKDGSKDILELEFRHNSYNSPNNRLFDGFAAFDLKPFRKEGIDSIPVHIKVKDWDGEQEYKLMYKYNSINPPSKEENRVLPAITSNEYS